jgi:hypothetical protein
MSTIKVMTDVKIFKFVHDNFNVVGLSTNVNYEHKCISKL